MNATAAPQKNASIALTGGSGLVGSHVAAELAERGCRLRLGLRQSSSKRWLQGINFTTTPFQLDRPENFGELVRATEVVVHCAAITRAERDTEYRVMNTEAAVELARAAARAGARRFVFVSSLAARGPDGSDGPDSAYGHSKLEAERRLATMTGLGDMEVLCLRLGGVYGPRDSDFLPLFKAASRGIVVLPPRRRLLQPLFSQDAAKAIAAACFSPPCSVPLAICEARAYQWQEVADYMRALLGDRLRVLHLPAGFFTTAARLSTGWARLMGRAPQLDMRRGRDIARNSWTCNTSTAERLLGWSAETPLERGLALSWDWYRDQGLIKA